MYAFNPALDAKTAVKERFVWMLFMGITFFLLYGSSNQYAGLSAPHPSIFMEWEKDIPFVEYFIVPYMSSDLMFVVAFFLPYTRLELRILSARVLFIVTLSCLIFVLFPLSFAFEKPEIQTFHTLFNMLQADLPYNQLPSLHISFAIVLWASMRKHLTNIVLRIAVATWFYLIALSTLFVYQHHFIDIPTGFLMGIVAVTLISKKRNTYFVTQFTTPRSLKMGLYFLIGACLLLIASFYMGVFTFISLYLSFSLFSVSIVYAFGLNELLVSKNAQANFWQWLIFAPYFIGSYLSWHYYKRKISLFVPVKDNVYLGRHPAQNEYNEIQDKNITSIINLASEQQIHKKHLNIKQMRFPYLDQTIQSPQSLHKAVELIESCKDDGVLIHCALGLSRSILLVSAWLLYNKYTLDEIETLMGQIRPNYVKSPYMNINLEMYQEYLQNQKENSYVD